MAEPQAPSKRPRVTFDDVFRQVCRAAEMAQQAKDDGCNAPELSAALGKCLGAMAAMEKRATPAGSMVQEPVNREDTEQ